MKGKWGMKIVENYTEPRDIYEKIGTNASELSEAEHGFICGLIKKYKPKKIVELGVSGGGNQCSYSKLFTETRAK